VTAAAQLPDTPCEFDQDFLDDSPYDPSVLLLDRILELDREGNLVRCRMPTEPPDPFTSAQRSDPVRHPAHVAGAALIQATASLGFVHAYYLLGLRHREGGWIGYGTRIQKAVFRKLVTPGTPIEATCIATRVRLGEKQHVVRYRFDFRADGDRCYESEQTAFWFRTRVD
jgi:3-hydroxymyristoyl/3-hydroxydecanoyl-(acyl carrier protein) dehydratase